MKVNRKTRRTAKPAKVKLRFDGSFFQAASKKSNEKTRKTARMSCFPFGYGIFEIILEVFGLGNYFV